MSRPYVGLFGRALAARRKERMAFRDVFCLHEELRERLVGGVCGRRRKHELQIGCHLDLPVAMSAIGDRQAPNFGVVFG